MGFSIKDMWAYNCPRCRKGKMFVEPFEFGKPLAMNDRCAHCNLKMESEPGFYFGAMFVSYVISSFFLLLPTLLLVFYFKWSTMAAISFTLALAALTYLRFLRGSRALWLHMMVKYDVTKVAK